MVQTAKKADQEESKDEEAILVPSFPYNISFVIPSAESFQKTIVRALNYAYKVEIGEIPRDRGAPADGEGFLSDFVHKVRVKYNVCDIRIKKRSVMRKVEDALVLKDIDK